MRKAQSGHCYMAFTVAAIAADQFRRGFFISSFADLSEYCLGNLEVSGIEIQHEREKAELRDWKAFECDGVVLLKRDAERV